jgi:hypothetical protein
MIACMAPPVKQDPMLCGGPLVVTGARFGLSLQYDGTSPLLVPSWLFDVKGSDRAIAQVAVDPAYLAAPSNPCGDGRECATIAPEPCNTCATGAPSPVPMTATASPFTGEPVDPPLTPPTPSTAGDLLPVPVFRFTDVVLSQDHKSLEVTYRRTDGGICRGWVPEVKESDQQVLLFAGRADGPITTDAPTSCDATVTLSTPLGNRDVVDGHTGEVLLRP